MHVIWKPQAEKDLEAIEDYFLQVAPDYAEIIVDEIKTRVQQVEEFPRIGRMVPDMYDPAIREVYTEITALSIMYRNRRQTPLKF